MPGPPSNGKGVLQLRSWSETSSPFWNKLRHWVSFLSRACVLESKPSRQSRMLRRSGTQAGKGRAPVDAQVKENCRRPTERNSIPGVNDKNTAGLWALCQAHWRRAEGSLDCTWSELGVFTDGRLRAPCKQWWGHRNKEAASQYRMSTHRKGIHWPETVKKQRFQAEWT